MVGPPFPESTSLRALIDTGDANMTSKGHPSNGSHAGEIDSLWVLGARLTWTILGPAALLLLVFGIVTRGSGWTTGLDAGFGVVVGLMLLGRWVEQRSGSATTLQGEPASPHAYRRYLVAFGILAAVVWVAVNLLGNHLLN